MPDPIDCPKCQSENIYNDGHHWNCPVCFHEWDHEDNKVVNSSMAEEDTSIRDANGQILLDGDSITVLKDLKIKGTSSVVKGGTKARNIRLTDGHDGHNIVCKIEGLGTINLKSEFVRKA